MRSVNFPSKVRLASDIEAEVIDYDGNTLGRIILTTGVPYLVSSVEPADPRVGITHETWTLDYFPGNQQFVIDLLPGEADDVFTAP